jgi:hypothetical protein
MTRNEGRRARKFYNYLYFLFTIWVIYDVFTKRGYLSYDKVDGFIRVKAKNPNELKYSTEPVRNETRSMKLDSSVLVKSYTDSTLIFPTRVVTTVQNISMDLSETNVSRSDEYYLKNIEDYVVKINAHIVFPNVINSKTQRPVTVHLESLHSRIQHWESRKVIKEFLPSVDEPEIPLGMFLEASGTFLNEESDSFSKKNPTDTYRDEGLVLYVEIECNNAKEYTLWNALKGGTVLPVCAYNVNRISHSEYKRREVIRSTKVSEFVIEQDISKEHGIYLDFKLAGKIGVFSWNALIIYCFSRYGVLRLILFGVNTAYSLYKLIVPNKQKEE